MDGPDFPPPIPGRSALPSFLAVEDWARDEIEDAERDAAERVTQAESDAVRIQEAGQGTIDEAARAAEQLAVADAEARAASRVRHARESIDRWIETSETTLTALVDDALRYLCGEDEHDAQ